MKFIKHMANIFVGIGIILMALVWGAVMGVLFIGPLFGHVPYGWKGFVVGALMAIVTLAVMTYKGAEQDNG
jgi:uncharacterized membrane protein